jgi:hypothetical protein
MEFDFKPLVVLFWVLAGLMTAFAISTFVLAIILW